MKLFFTTTLLLISMFVFSQNTYDSRLNVKYSDEYLQTLSQEKINLLEYKLDNVYMIIENFEKNETLQELYRVNNSTKQIIEQSLTNIDFDNFNIFEYYFEQKYDSRTYYKIGNTGKTLVILSIKEFTQKYNEFKNLQ